MPVEFSVAAYRFGHSMVRPRYQLNEAIEAPIFSTNTATSLIWGIPLSRPTGPLSWQFFFVDLDHGAGSKRHKGQGLPQACANPQLSLNRRCLACTRSAACRPGLPGPSTWHCSNLERGAIFQLPSGQSVARALRYPSDSQEPGSLDRQGVLMMISGSRSPRWQAASLTMLRFGPTSCPRRRSRRAEAPTPSLAKDDIPIKLGPLGGRLVFRDAVIGHVGVALGEHEG